MTRNCRQLHSIFILLAINLFSNVNTLQPPEDGFYKREHSLIKPYASGGKMPFFETTGDTIVTNSYIRLTPDEKSRTGGIWNKIPCYQPNWQIDVTFKVHGASRALAADGFALWYIDQKRQIGPTFGGPESFKGMAIFIDTYKNGQNSGAFPRISGFINDGSWSYNHDNDGDKQSFGHCYAMVRNRDHDTHLKIRYEDKKFQVHVDVDGQNNWRICFEKDNVVLPTGYYFGFSAKTGDLTDNHELTAIRTYQIGGYERADPALAQETPRIEYPEGPDQYRNDANESGSSGRKWALLIISLGVIGYGCFIAWQKRNEANRKRFY